MPTFCSKLRRIYDDTVHFCFSTVVEYDNDDIEANVEYSGDDIFGKGNFKPGVDLYYERGDGHNETARHINTVEVNGAKLNKIQLSCVTLRKNSLLVIFSCWNIQILQTFLLVLKLIARRRKLD